MTTPDEKPQERPAPGAGHYGEISPGVPRYGQYAPEGWQPPSPEAPAGPHQPPSAPNYPGFGGQQPSAPIGTPLPHRGAGSLPPGQHLAPPARVILACRLIMGAGVLQALSGILLVVLLVLPSGQALFTDAIKTAGANNPELATALNDPSLLTTALVLAAIISVAAAATYFWLASAIRKGRNWARTTALVLGCLSLFLLTQPNVFSIVQVLLGVVAVALLFRSPAKEYFIKPGRQINRY